MEVIIGKYMKDKPGAFSSGRCIVTEAFRKAGRWLMGRDFNKTPAQNPPGRNGPV